MFGPKVYPNAFQRNDGVSYSRHGGDVSGFIIEVIREDASSLKDEEFLITIHTPVISPLIWRTQPMRQYKN
eukprot:12896986-Prorocentrum_lima.AAC.1